MDRWQWRRRLMVVALAGLVIWGQARTVLAAEPSAEPSAERPTTRPTMQLVETTMIWDQAQHNAFTDLVRFQDRWYCTFREAIAHGPKRGDPYSGKVRVLVSEDAKNWSSVALFEDEGGDLRDPKLSVTPDERLMLNSGVMPRPPSERTFQSLVWFSPDGKTWSDRQPVADPDVWLWKVTWHEGVAYGIGYARREPHTAHLYRSRDGVNYEVVVRDLQKASYPNEAALVFQADGTAVCLLRREAGPKTAMVGTARPPYEQWEWKDLGERIGGLALIQIPDGRFIAGGRFNVAGKGARMV